MKGNGTAKGKTKVLTSGAGAFAKGGNGHMVPKTGAVPQKSGTSSPSKGGVGSQKAKGGSGHMAGFSPAMPMKPGTSSPARKGK